MITALEVAFWASLAALVWTHLLYPPAIAVVARVRPRPVAAADILPTVGLIIPAYNEEDVIDAKLENALALDYPADRLEVVVTSDDSTDGTRAAVERFAGRGVRLIHCPRGGKVAAQDRAVAETTGEIVAFGDANVRWDADALRRLVRPFADPDVGMACGNVRLVNPAGGTNQEGLYWRYEMWLRRRESLAHSMTGSNGAIYAVRREAYREVDPRFGHDLSFPYLMVQNGYRAVYEPSARATESMNHRHRGRVPPQGAHVRALLADPVSGAHVRPAPAGPDLLGRDRVAPAAALLERPLHLVLLASSAALATHGAVYATALAAQLAGLALVGVSMLLRGRVRVLRVLHYYLLVTLATVIALVGYLRRGVPATWDKAAGSRM